LAACPAGRRSCPAQQGAGSAGRRLLPGQGRRPLAVPVSIAGRLVAAKHVNPTTLLFNPSRLDTSELESSFVGRKKLLERLEQGLPEVAARHTSRHGLLIGLRGLGKSHLVELLARRLQRDHGWSMARIPEEHYQVAHLADLLEQIVMRADEGPPPFADEADP